MNGFGKLPNETDPPKKATNNQWGFEIYNKNIQKM